MEELEKIQPGNAILLETEKFWVIPGGLVLVPVGKIHGRMCNGLIL